MMHLAVLSVMASVLWQPVYMDAVRAKRIPEPMQVQEVADTGTVVVTIKLPKVISQVH